jgi:FHA domain-containing protein
VSRLADNPFVAGNVVCAVCGTVNVGVFARCIACGQELGRAVAEVEVDEAARPQTPDVPLAQESGVSGPVATARTTGSTGKPRSTKSEQAALELDSASFRQTVLEMPAGQETAPVRGRRDGEADTRRVKASRGMDTGPAHTTPEAQSDTRWIARLLLPEGDRRSVEIGSRGVTLGSGLDELGLPGDPRAIAGEARLVVDDGRLFVEPSRDSVNVYRRIDREVRLREGDVVLIGDVAAAFVAVDPPAAVDGSRQVVGGSSNAPCGRLVFLRRDGSPGPVHDLPAGKTVLGRTDGHMNFPHDARLSRRHALFFASDQGVTLEDMESRNGTYLRVRERQELRADDALRVGSAGVQIRVR